MPITESVERNLSEGEVYLYEHADNAIADVENAARFFVWGDIALDLRDALAELAAHRATIGEGDEVEQDNADTLDTVRRRILDELDRLTAVELIKGQVGELAELAASYAALSAVPRVLPAVQTANLIGPAPYVGGDLDLAIAYACKYVSNLPGLDDALKLADQLHEELTSLSVGGDLDAGTWPHDEPQPDGRDV